MPGPRRALDPRRGDLDPCRGERAHLAVVRVEPDADELSVHLHVVDPSVRLERRTKPGVIDAGDEKVLVGVRDPEKLVAHGAADDVGVEVETADVCAQRGRHALILPARRVGPSGRRASPC